MGARPRASTLPYHPHDTRTQFGGRRAWGAALAGYNYNRVQLGQRDNKGKSTLTKKKWSHSCNLSTKNGFLPASTHRPIPIRNHSPVPIGAHFGRIALQALAARAAAEPGEPDPRGPPPLSPHPLGRLLQPMGFGVMQRTIPAFVCIYIVILIYLFI